jgi:hypothetical protein
MPAGTLYDTGAPTIEVRIYRDDRILVRELCESEEDAAALVELWADVDNVYTVVGDLSAKHGPGDVLAAEEPVLGSDENDYPLADARLPSYGTE